MIYLASKSPRRQELLGRLGLPFAILTQDVDETMDPALPPEREVIRVSQKKAAAVGTRVGPLDVVIAADTIVVLENQILGKPHTPQRAKAMLLALSGKEHQVITGLTVCRGGRQIAQAVKTQLSFRPLGAAEIDAYVATGDPLDKAGAYGIQGPAAVFVSRLEGDYYNVMGLPLCALTLALRQLGVEIMGQSGSDEVKP